MTEKQEKPKIPRITPSGLPRLRSATIRDYLVDYRKIYNTEIGYRQDLAKRLKSIADENPRFVEYFLYPKSIDDVLDPTKAPKHVINELSGAVTAYNILKAQAIRNQD